MVWYDAAGDCDGFQVCYDFGRGEHALTWRPKLGFAHNRIDQGDDSLRGNKMTPILVPAGVVPWSQIVRLFGERGVGLESGLREWVSARLAARK